MEHLKSVLAAVDFSDCSKCALVEAARLAARDGAKLRVLHVIEPEVVRDLEERMPKGSATREGIVADAGRALAKFLSGAAPAGTEIEVTVGNPHETMLAKARAVSADLLVIGAYGVTGEGRGAGSLALAIARKSPVNVLLVDGSHKQAFRSAMVGIDFSDHSRHALDQALHVARLDRCPLHAVHVFAPPPLHYRAPTPEASPTYQKQFQAALLSRLEEFVAAANKAAGGKVEVTCSIVEHTSYGQGIIDFAGRKKVDLVVLGTIGKTNLRHMLLGGTAERVVRDTPCSVLAVPPRE